MTVDFHLVIGSTGAGKSTYARTLAAQTTAVRFAVDEWMDALYSPDRPAQAGFEWFGPRVERCTEQIYHVAKAVAAVGQPSVLEIGMTQRAARQAFYERVERDGFCLQLHVILAPAEVRWQRVQARNRERGETYSLEVTRPMFDFVEGLWEPPDARELAATQGVVTNSG